MMNSSQLHRTKIKENQYKMKEIIGSGNFGEVTKCEHIENGNIFAVKTIMVNEMYVQKIQQEASNMLVSRSQYILELVDHFYDKSINSYVLVTPYYKNGSLEHIIQKNWELNQLLLFFYQMSKALGVLYKEKICHLDVKPENILLRANHQYVICDLGCSRQLDSNSNLNVSMNNMAISTNARGGGTAQYGSPDLVLNSEMNDFSDIWSLGIILYKIIYSKHPLMIIPSKYGQRLIAFQQEKLFIPYPQSAKFGPIVPILKRMLVCSSNKPERIKWDEILSQIYKVVKIPFAQQNYIITNFDTLLEFINNASIIISALLHYLEQLKDIMNGQADDLKPLTKQLCIYLVTITKEISMQTKEPRLEGWQFYLFDVTRQNLTIKQIEFAQSLERQASKLCNTNNVKIEYQGFTISTKKTAMDCLKLNKLLNKVAEPTSITKKIDKRKAESISDFIAIKNKLEYSQRKGLKQFVVHLINS